MAPSASAAAIASAVSARSGRVTLFPLRRGIPFEQLGNARENRQDALPLVFNPGEGHFTLLFKAFVAARNERC